MIDVLFQIGFSNTCFALLLAALALIVGAKSKRPHVAHLLWILVLVKLLTPPVFNMPVEFSLMSPSAVSIEISEFDDDSSLEMTQQDWNSPTRDEFVVDPLAHDARDHDELDPTDATSVDKPVAKWSGVSSFWVTIKPWLGIVWLGGSLIIILISLIRIFRFDRLLRLSSRPADETIQVVARRLGKRLGLKAMPKIMVTTARICPMVWWVGRRPSVTIPESVIEKLEPAQWQWVLAHELSHVCRRDYLVRWLEWLSCAVAWWNPVVWIAQRNLRASEEICCDQLVLTKLQPGLQTYAESIFLAVETLVRPVLRPPTMASEINSGGFLQRRIEMIMSGKSASQPLLLQFCIAAIGLLFIPLGIVGAQDFDAVKKRLTKAVNQDEITLEQAAIMMQALRESAMHHDREMHEREMHEREMHEREMHEREMHEREMHEREMHERDREMHDRDREMHDREMHEREMHEREMHERNRKRERDREQALHQAREELRELYQAGKLTREEMEERFHAMERELHQAERREQQHENRWTEKEWDEEKEHENEFVDLQERYQRAVREIKQAIESGRISEEEAKSRLEDLRRRMTEEKEDNEESDEDDRKQRYRRAEIEFRRAVESGRISEEFAEERLQGLRRQLWEDDEDDDADHEEDGDEEERKQVYQRAERELDQAIASGRISEKEAKKRLEGLARELWGKKGDDDEGHEDDDDEHGDGYEDEDDDGDLEDRDERRRDANHREREFEQIVNEIEQAVDSGTLSKEDAKQKIIAIKKKLFGSGDKNRDNEKEKELVDGPEMGAMFTLA